MSNFSIWGVILAAGQGSRLAKAGIKTRKQFLDLEGKPVFWRSARTFSRVPETRGLVFVFPPEEFQDQCERLAELLKEEELALAHATVQGGERRQDSVYNGLSGLPMDCTHVLVHDAARPFFTPKLCADLIDALKNGAQAVVPGLAVKDTIKRVDGDRILSTLDRHELRAVQTPQGFALPVLKKAHDAARAEGWEVTDDASMVERLGIEARVVPGEEENIKITTPADLAALDKHNQGPEQPLPCSGLGYDVHRFAGPDDPKARPCKLGGIPIPGGPFVLAHSDGDVLLHALTDAMLALICQGDIGTRFPDSSPEFDNMESSIFLTEVLQDVLKAGLRLTHVDLTIVAQIPKLSPHRELIRRNIASLLGLESSRVNVKATTEEGLGFTGEKKGIKAYALVSGLKPAD